MEFRVLGPLEVLDEGRGLELGGPKQRALLALLLLDANRPVSRDRLIDGLWEDEPTATAAKALQVYVSHLRKTLGSERVVTHAGGYLLRADPDELDLGRFERLYEDGKPNEALALWRGAPLSEFGQQRFAQAAIARLEELYLACLEARIEGDVAEGRNVLGELDGLVQKHPLRERLRELHLLALYRGGRQADALAAYQDARTALVEGLGIEPRKPLRDLHQAILRQDPALDQPPTEPSRGAFVGRHAELEQLVAGLNGAMAGRGRLFVLIGEPGIGKSRLAEELIHVARTRRFEVLIGRCWEAGGAPAYWPWVQSLRPVVDEAPPELQRVLSGDPASAESDSARFLLFDETAEFLRDASRGRPLLLFLDDMHAADEPSLLLLRYLAREIAAARILIVVACRDVDPVAGRPLVSMLGEVVREPGTTLVSLHGLSRSEVAEYVTVAASEPDGSELVETLYEQTDGNPFFLAETVRLLTVEGRIAVPPSLREVIARRLSHLSDECRRVLVRAAVLGREFDHAALAAMSEVSLDALLESLDEGITARLVSDVPDAAARSRFAHVLIRDALYQGLTSARRARLHRAAVEVLEKLGGEDAELAYHAIAGHDLEKALRSARRAGDHALALLAYEEAARLYDLALAADPAGPVRCEVLLARGDAEMRAGRTGSAKETFLAAAVMARKLEDSYALARAATGYGGRIVWSRAGDDERLIPILEEGLAALGHDDAELRPRLLARLAGALRDQPSRERRDSISLQAVELARTGGDPATLAFALVGRAHAIVAPDTISEVQAAATELCEVAAAAGDLERLEAGHLLRFMCEHWLGDRASMQSDLTKIAEIAETLKQPVHRWELAGVRAMLALAEGRFEDGASLSNEAFELGMRAIPDQATSHYCMHRYALYEFRGGLATLEPEVAELVRQQPARPVFACAHAYLLATLGYQADARRRLANLVNLLPFDQEWLFGMSLLAEAAVLVSDSDVTAAAYDALAPWAQMNAADQSEGSRGSLARNLGQLATALRRWQDAATHFDFALAMNERMGCRPWLARTQNDYARLLRLTGDADKAAALEQAALITYKELAITIGPDRRAYDASVSSPE